MAAIEVEGEEEGVLEGEVATEEAMGWKADGGGVLGGGGEGGGDAWRRGWQSRR